MRFKDVTNENLHVVTMLQKNLIGPNVKIYQSEETMVVYSYGQESKHISLSNPSRKIKDSEVKYAIRRIMGTNETLVSAYMSANGVIHISPIKVKAAVH
jgi:hypothetical protein